MNTMLNTLIQFFQSGGPFMYPILAVLAIGLAITLERYFYLSASKITNRRMIAKLLPLLEKGEMNSAVKMAKGSSATVPYFYRARIVSRLRGGGTISKQPWKRALWRLFPASKSARTISPCSLTSRPYSGCLAPLSV